MFTLIQPLMLWALPLAVLPVLLRFLRHTAQLPEIPFSATWLLEKAAAAEQARQRRREWLLLTTRILTLVFLVVAFARPARQAKPWPSDLGQSNPNSILFLDQSFSLTSNQIGARLINLVEGSTRVARGPYHHPALDTFEDPTKGDLRQVYARKWWQLEPVGRTVVIARFDNGDPFLIEHWTDDNRRLIVCTVARDLSWSNLELDPNYLRLLDSVHRYLLKPITTSSASSPLITNDYTAWCLGLVILLALVEIGLGGWALWKGVSLALLAVLVIHPTIPLPTPRPVLGRVLLLVDRTPSMQFRADAVNRVVNELNSYPRVDLTGNETALGEAIASAIQQSPRAIILVSDGQHNQGISPTYVAARYRIPIFPIAAGQEQSAPDVSVVSLDVPPYAWPDERVSLDAGIATSIANTSLLTATLVIDDTSVASTNILAGTIHLLIPSLPPGTHRGELRISSIPAEVTTANNVRPFQLTIFPRNIRAAIQANKVDWEFRHVLNAMRRDPAVELVTDPVQADVVIETTGETWRMRKDGPDVFQTYWSRRVRLEWMVKQHPSIPPPSLVSDELYRLDINAPLLTEIARVSGGEMFTEQTIRNLPRSIDAHEQAHRTKFNLLEHGWILVALVLLVVFAWLKSDRKPAPAPRNTDTTIAL